MPDKISSALAFAALISGALTVTDDKTLLESLELTTVLPLIGAVTVFCSKRSADKSDTTALRTVTDTPDKASYPASGESEDESPGARLNVLS